MPGEVLNNLYSIKTNARMVVRHSHAGVASDRILFRFEPMALETGVGNVVSRTKYCNTIEINSSGWPCARDIMVYDGVYPVRIPCFGMDLVYSTCIEHYTPAVFWKPPMANNKSNSRDLN